MNRTALALSILLVATACKKQPPVEDPADTTLSVAPNPNVPTTLPDAIAKMRDHFQRVQFEFDSSTLDAESKSALEANVAIMQAYPSILIEVQGHADERGTTEYNIGLGDRRAEAVKKYMITMGVKNTRVTTVSYGEERPLEAGSGEVVWSKNRRAEFRILAESGSTPVKGTTE